MRDIKQAFTLAIFYQICLSAEGFKASWTPETYPNPIKDFKSCGRHQPSTICDPDNVLSSAARDEVQKALNTLRADYKHPNCRDDAGYDLVVVLADDIEVYRSESDQEAAERFATQLFNSFGVGNPECQNGMLLFLAMSLRKSFLATGAGTREYVTDSEAGMILESMKELLRDSDTAGAILKAVDNVAQVLSGNSMDSWASSIQEYMLVFGIFGVFSVFFYLTDRKERRYKAAAQKLTEIEKQRADALAQKYQSESCPICLEAWDATAGAESQMVLRCGHQYHRECIDKWEDSTCPICREDTSKSMKESSARPVSRSSNSVWSRYEPEYRFRLARAHHYFPNHISQSSLTRYQNDCYCPLSTDEAFLRSSPSYTSSSGSGSSGSGFAGGVCSGGASGGW